MKYSVFGESLKGNGLEQNVDNLLVDTKINLFMICDAKGEDGKGMYASRLVIDFITQVMNSQKGLLKRIKENPNPQAIEALSAVLEEAVEKTSFQIRKAIMDDPKRRMMGTSLVMMAVVGELGFIIKVGEGRLYLHREGEMHLLTETKKSKSSQDLDLDDKTKIQMSLGMGNVLGSSSNIKMEVLTIELNPGDRFLIASDGVYSTLEDSSISKVLGDTKIENPSEYILKKIKDSGLYDNSSAISICFEETEEHRAKVTAHQKFEALKNIPLFSLLDFNEIAKVISKMSQRKISAGEKIVTQGDKGEELFVMLSGKAEIIVNNKIITELKAGDYFGELSLIDKAPRSATVQALTDLETLVMEKKQFYKIISKERKISIKLLWRLTKTLSSRLRETDQLLTEVEEGRKFLKSSDDLALEFEID